MHCADRPASGQVECHKGHYAHGRLPTKTRCGPATARVNKRLSAPKPRAQPGRVPVTSENLVKNQSPAPHITYSSGLKMTVQHTLGPGHGTRGSTRTKMSGPGRRARRSKLASFAMRHPSIVQDARLPPMLVGLVVTASEADPGQAHGMFGTAEAIYGEPPKP